MEARTALLRGWHRDWRVAGMPGEPECRCHQGPKQTFQKLCSLNLALPMQHSGLQKKNSHNIFRYWAVLEISLLLASLTITECVGTRADQMTVLRITPQVPPPWQPSLEGRFHWPRAHLLFVRRSWWLNEKNGDHRDREILIKPYKWKYLIYNLHSKLTQASLACKVRLLHPSAYFSAAAVD